MLHVIATATVKPGQREAFLAEFRKVVPEVLREEGCIEYGPTVDLPTNLPAQGDERPDVVVILEKWESVEALEKHLVAPHMMEYRNRVKDLVESVSLQILKPV